MLYGPPGTGKTFLAKACATESNAVFFSVSSADIMSKYVGDSEKQVKRIFNRARKSKHSIIFVDEIDSMVSAWSDNENEATKKVKTEFLTQMDGVQNSKSRPMVLGATNLPWTLDTAIIRRFPWRIYIPLPDESSWKYMVLHALKNEFYQLNEQEINEVVKLTEGFSGSDMSILMKETFYKIIEEFKNARYFT